jgi:PAS domain S-box-containing protein/putative nucleotidyltransferase with HDIG domain
MPEKSAQKNKLIQLNLLIVEDNPSDAELNVLQLEKAGYRINWRRVQTEQEFLEALESAWDLVLADWSLPQFSGLRALQLLRGKGFATPFIIVSGQISGEEAVNAMHQGANDYLLKERPERLEQAVENALESRRLANENKRMLEKLQESEEKYRGVVEHANDGITIIQDEVVKYANPNLLKLFGESRLEDVLGKPFLSYVHAEERERVLQRYQRRMAGQSVPSVYDSRLKEILGQSVPVEINASIITYLGRPADLVILRNISERKRAERVSAILLETQDRLIQIDQLPELYQMIGGQILKLIEKGFVLISVLDEEIDAIKLAGLFGFGNLYEQLTRLYKIDPLKIPYYLKDMTSEELALFRSRGLKKFNGGLYRLMTGRVAKTICKTAEKMMKIKEILTMGFIIGDSHFGGVTLLTQTDISDYQPSIEMIVNLAAIAINRIRSMSAMHQSESRLKEAQKIGRIGDWEFDVASNSIKWSDDVFKLYERDPILGVPSAEEEATYYLPEQTRQLHEYSRLAIEKGQEFSYDLQANLPSGRIAYFSASMRPVKDEKGKVVKLFGTVQDITERKKKEEQFNYQVFLLNNVSDAIIASDETSRMNFFNDAARNLFGWRADEALGKVSRDLLKTEYVGQSREEAWETMMRKGAWRGEITRVRKDGIRIPLEISIMALMGEKGKNLGTVGIMRDISERKQAEREIQKRMMQLTTARQIGATLIETLELDQINERLYQAITSLLPDSETMFISLFDPQKAQFRCIFAMSEGERYDASQLPPAPLEPPGIGTQSEVVHTRQPLIVANLAERLKKIALVVDMGDKDEKPQSGLYVPMLAKGEVIGVVTVQSRKAGRYTQDDADMLVLVANTAAIAIQNARLHEQTEKRLQQISAMHMIDVAISNSFDLGLTFNILIDTLVSQLGIHAANILKLNMVTQELEYLSVWGYRNPPMLHSKLPTSAHLSGMVLLERKAIVVDDLETEFEKMTRAAEAKKEGFKAYIGVPLISKGEMIGLLEVFQREKFNPSKDWLDFMETMGGQLAIAIDNATLFNNLQKSNLELQLAYDATITGWSNALDLRDKETEGHSQRVTDMAVMLAKRIGLDEEALIHLRWGALLHDIGKIGISDSVLNKPGALTEEEWVLMRRHPSTAFELISPIAFLKKAVDIPYCHHENWDGSGYPRGLKGEQIPLASRIFSVVDVWDALTSDRPYRKAWKKEEAKTFLREKAGQQFDPQVVSEFIKSEIMEMKN